MSKSDSYSSITENSTDYKGCKSILQELCRCCMIHTSKESQFMFGSSYKELFTRTTSLEINEQDTLPKVLCQNCSSQLDSIKGFREKCIETDRKLQELVKEEVLVKHEIKADEEGLKNEEQDTQEDYINDNNSDSSDEETLENKKQRRSRRNSKNEMDLTCPKCDFEANDTKDIKKHYKDNKKCRIVAFTCQICNVNCKYSSALNRHMIVHSSVKGEYKCNFCDNFYSYKGTLSQHLRQRHNESDASNEKKVLIESSAKKAKISSSTPNSQNEIDLTCSLCNFKANTIKEIKNHYKENEECKTMAFSCSICNLNCKYNSALKLHMTVHTSVKGEYKCNFCNNFYSYKGTLTQHLRQRHSETDASNDKKVFGENECDSEQHIDNSTVIEPEILIKYETQNNEILEHESCLAPNESENPPDSSEEKRRKATPNSPRKKRKITPKQIKVECFTCHLKFDSKSSLKDHCKENSSCKPKSYICEICSLNCRFESTLIRHMTVHNFEKGGKEFKCNICGVSYGFKRSLQQHLQNQHNNFDNVANKDQRNICKTCNAEFYSSCKLSYHIRQEHPDELKFICDSCGKCYNSPQALKSHWDRIHNPNQKPQDSTCKICGEEFPTKNKLLSHMNSKHLEKKHLCTYCGKAFITRAALEAHVRIHTKEKPFSCHLCSKAFRVKIELKDHINIHTGEIPFACDLCGRKFRTRALLSSHKMVHSGIKKHKCDICGQCFALSGTLTVHRRRHTGERPYKCPFCEKGFIYSTTRKQHIQSAHGQVYNPNATNY